MNKKFIIAISHGDYTRGDGGTDKVILAHQKILNKNNKSMLHICPWTMNGILRKKIWLVHVDGKEIGVFTNGRLVNYIQGLGYNGYELLDIFIHHLKNIEIADLETVLDYTSVPIYFYIHDYFTVCPFNGLVDSDGRYCGCGFPNKKKCLTCNYFSELEIKRVAEIKKLFAHFENRLQFVAPSDNAKDNWNQDYPQYKNKVRVIYHQTFEGIYSGNSKTVEIGEPIRIAFVGYQIKHKGWDEWKKAVTANSGNTKYEFFQFGWGEDHLDNCKQISVDFKENLNAMTYALRKNEIHCAVIWSTWPETYSYTYYEALAANCFIITNSRSGNVCYQTKIRENGIVDDDLVLLLEDDCELRTRVNQYRQSQHLTPNELVENTEMLTLLTMPSKMVYKKSHPFVDYSVALGILRRIKNKVRGK